MNDYTAKTAVIFLVFNRPEATERVFAEIRHVKPPVLLVVADGPRHDRPDEKIKCERVRAIVNQVDWPCKMITNYSDTNMGCQHRVSTGLTWAFDIVEEAIVLEDDCVPEPTFFHFCDELLERYRNDERIMLISGNNFQFGRKRTKDSYYFSRFNHIWGWASWRRAWAYYDDSMKHWPKIKDGDWLRDLLPDTNARQYWSDIFQATYEQRINSWGFRWTFACWINNGLTILPRVNLVANIGCNPEGTHSFDVSNPVANLKTEVMTFPLKHPEYMICDQKADDWTQRSIFRQNRRTRIMNRFRKILSLFRR